MLQVDTMVLIIVVVLVTYRVHADPSISTSTPTPCYGDVVTLVCHHPEVGSNPGRYLTTGPVWRENGVGITPSTGVYLQPDTSEDLTRTTLNITLTVDHFRNKSFNYSCQLVLAENGLPIGEVETSENVTVDPVGQPTAQGTEGGACFGRSFFPTCLRSYTTDYDTIWCVNGSGIGTSDLVCVVRGNILVVTNITEDLFSNVVTTFKCAVLLNGTEITGESYLINITQLYPIVLF